MIGSVARCLICVPSGSLGLTNKCGLLHAAENAMRVNLEGISLHIARSIRCARAREIRSTFELQRTEYIGLRRGHKAQG
jgi:hypothetical protein